MRNNLNFIQTIAGSNELVAGSTGNVQVPDRVNDNARRNQSREGCLNILIDAESYHAGLSYTKRLSQLLKIQDQEIESLKSQICKMEQREFNASKVEPRYNTQSSGRSLIAHLRVVS